MIECPSFATDKPIKKTLMNKKNDTVQARMLMISYWVFNSCRYTKYFILIAQATMSSPPNNYSGKFLAQKDDQFTCSLFCCIVATFYCALIAHASLDRPNKLTRVELLGQFRG